MECSGVVHAVKEKREKDLAASWASFTILFLREDTIVDRQEHVINLH